MKLKSVEFKNFGSYGSAVQSINFTDIPSFYLVVGENGHGKSTIADVIRFILFGKVPNKKLKDLVNRFNGGAWGKLQFESAKGQDVIVERTADPSSIKLFVDGKPYDKALKKGPGEYLTDELVEIPFHVFNNVILISCSDFKSFLTMSPADKRAIVDKIFGFAIINNMRSILKDEIKKVSDELTKILGGIDSIDRSLRSSSVRLEELSAKILQEEEDKTAEMTENLEKYKQLLTIHADKRKELSGEREKYNDKGQKLMQIRTSLKSQRDSLDKKLSLYKNHKCPMCGSDLHTELHISVMEGLQAEVDAIMTEQEKAETVYAKLKEKNAELSKREADMDEKGYKIKNAISQFQTALSKKKDDPAEGERQIQSIRKIVSDMESELEISKSKRSETESDVTWKRLLDEALSEKGIKQLAIKSILPSLNSEVQKMLLEMHLDFNVVFDEEWEAKISHLGNEISVETLSAGEKNKTNFVVLMAVLRLMKMRFPAINILFLDEIFANIDAEGIYNVLKILKKNSTEMNLNTFVISHTHSIPTELFDYQMDVKKIEGFSTLNLKHV